MKKYSYHREQISMLTQFSAAFDDCFLYRYTKDGVPKEKIDVRYVFGPKDRVIYDIVNPAKVMTLPVIAMEQTNIKRDASRVQNKDQFIYRASSTGSSNNLARVPTPIPVTIDISVSIIAKYKEDIDQIVSNLIPYCNPYFVIVWKTPESYGIDFIDEIRSEVSWSGSVDFENPTNLNNQDKYRIVGNTNFTIKGWIFPEDYTPQAPIYIVNTDFIAVDLAQKTYTQDDYQSLSSISVQESETMSVSAYPSITNLFYSTGGTMVPIISTINIHKNLDNNFMIYGKNLSYNNTWYLSSNNTTFNSMGMEIDTIHHSPISGNKIPSTSITTYSDNIVSISLKSNYLSSGSYTIIAANNVYLDQIDHNLVVI